MSKTILTETVADLAADSPLSYEQLAELNRGRELAARLMAMTPRERIGAAAVLAERTGRELSKVLDAFARLVEGAPVPPPAAPAVPVAPRKLVPSGSRQGLYFVVAVNGASCTCESFKFRGWCRHSREARENWQARVRATLAARIGAAQARAMARPLAA